MSAMRTLLRKVSAPNVKAPARPATAARTGLAGAGFARDFSRVPAHADPLEEEADRVADEVFGAPGNASAVAPQSPSGDVPPPSVERVLNTPGGPLSPALRHDMERRFGRDFGGVRVHLGASAERSARDVHADAYTSGRDIVFGPNQYRPHSEAGRRLVAHELTHVVQQSGAQPRLQRKPSANAEAEPDVKEEAGVKDEPVAMTAEGEGLAQGVDRIVMGCDDKALRIETPEKAYRYRMKTCSLPAGSYEARVTVTEHDFELDFGATVGGGEQFEFSYYVEPGQQNPATLLRKQKVVSVDVVERLGPPAKENAEDKAERTQVLAQLPDRELVPADSKTIDLFKPRKFKRTIWSHPVPLGMFGWMDLTAVASGGLNGSIEGAYGPGMLTDITLTRTIDPASAAEKDHPMLRGPSHAAGTYFVGGRARFRLPASAALRIAAEGRLTIAGKYLSKFEIAQVRAGLKANGVASAAGEINAMVNVVAMATHNETPAPVAESTPLAVMIEQSTIDGIDLAAEVGLRARAGLRFSVKADAGLEVAGTTLWQQDWNLMDYDAAVSWSGGLKYSPNPGPHWDLGALEAGEHGDDEEMADLEPRYDEADLEEDDIVDAIVNENRALVTAPDGLSQRTALPFIWYKPMELYPLTVDTPNADRPAQVHRDAGPTVVEYQERRRPMRELIGVADWPAERKTFQFMPYDARKEKEKERFKELVDRLGHIRSGTDVDHVWDLKLRGNGFDRFDNLWPASNQEQRHAGGERHKRQIINYSAIYPNLNGRWFEIVDFRHPA